MKVNAFLNGTILDATMDMIHSIDNADMSVEHIVIVPDRFSLQMEKILLENSKRKAIFNIRVMGISMLAEEILLKLGKQRDIISNAENLLITQLAIENVKDKFQYFSKSNITFCHEISKVIAQLKASNINSEDLICQTKGLTGAKYQDLLLILEEQKKLMDGRFDANDRLAFLCENIKDSDILKDTKFYFAQFDSFTQEGFLLIKTLIEKSKEVNISIAVSQNEGNEYLYEKDILQKLRTLSSLCGAQVNVFESKTNGTKEKNAIVKGFQSYENVNEKNDHFYLPFSSSNVEEECEGVAKLIYFYIQNGYRFKDMVLAVGDLEKYKNNLENIFNRFDFPYYIDESVTSDDSLLGKLILSFFDVIISHYSSDKIVNLCSNILLKNDEKIIENIQKYQVEGKGQYQKYIAKDFAYQNILDELNKAKTSQDFEKIVKEICSLVKDSYEELTVELENRELVKERKINDQIEEIVVKNAELISSYDTGEIDIEEYYKKLKLLLSFTLVSSVPTFVDAIMIGDATTSSYAQNKILFVLGCDNLPVVSTDNGIFSDDELSLQNLDKKIEPSIRMINRRNRFRLFNLLSQASEKLILSYQVMNDEGKVNEVPSAMDSLNKIFSENIISMSNVFDSSVSDSSVMIMGFGNRKNFVNQYYSFLSDENRESLGIEKFSPIRSDLKNISKPNEVFFNSNIVRVTQLEQYFSCPFKHFVTYGLKLQEKDIFAFDARDVGNICHNGAEIFVTYLMNNNYVFNVDIDKFINDNFNKFLDEKIKDKLSAINEKNVLIRFLKNQLKILFNDIIFELSHSQFKPKYLEKKINNISLGNVKKIDLIGKVDRIDECGQYFRILDYKTGKQSGVVKDLYYGTKLQLFLYQKITKDLINKIPAGVMYFNAKFDYTKADEDKALLKGVVANDNEIIPLYDYDIDKEGKSSILTVNANKKGGYGGASVAKDSLGVYEDYAEKVASQAVDEIAGGYIEPKPNEGACDMCKYQAICQYEKIYGTRKSARISSFKDLGVSDGKEE